MNNYTFKTKHTVVQTKNSDNNDVFGVRLDDERFQGVVIEYGKISFDGVDPDDADEIVLNFEYDILDDNDVDYDVTELEQYAGDVLQDILAFEMQRKMMGMDSSESEA